MYVNHEPCNQNHHHHRHKYNRFNLPPDLRGDGCGLLEEEEEKGAIA